MAGGQAPVPGAVLFAAPATTRYTTGNLTVRSAAAAASGNGEIVHAVGSRARVSAFVTRIGSNSASPRVLRSFG